MRLLVTRPRADADRFARLLAARGVEAIVAPLMEVRVLEGPVLDLGGVQALIATSANGVRALARRTTRRDVRLYTVGPQTAEAGRETGFADVVDAQGDADALARTVVAGADPTAGTLLHAAGRETAGRLSQTLRHSGFAVDAAVLYEAVPVTALPPEADDALRRGALSGVALFSPRSAKIFARLVEAAGLAERCAGLDAFCISSATATGLAPLSFRRVSVAGAPHQDAMLALLTPDSSNRA